MSGVGSSSRGVGKVWARWRRGVGSWGFGCLFCLERGHALSVDEAALTKVSGRSPATSQNIRQLPVVIIIRYCLTLHWNTICCNPTSALLTDDVEPR